MATPPVPSSSNNQPRGWICRESSLQNWALMLNTWASWINQGSDLLPVYNHWGLHWSDPTRCAMEFGLRNGTAATCCHPFLLAAFIWVSFGSGSGRECCKFIDCDWWEVWLYSLVSPHTLFNGFAWSSDHSLSIWPQPWHLKHCRALGSFMFWALPRAPVSAWVLPLLWEAVATLLAAEELQVEVLWPRPVQPLWELGCTAVFLSIHPLPWPLCLGLFGAVAGQVPCSALVRAAINLAIWSPSSLSCLSLQWQWMTLP